MLLNLAARLIPARRSQRSRRRRLQEIKHQCRAIPEGETIFVSIASYRDPQCPETVFDLFEKAACPSRVFVGVCQHNYDSDVDVLEGYRKLVARRGVGDFSDQVRVYRQRAEQAQGSMPARHSIEEQLYRNERYYLMIDSHTLLTPRWDTECIRMWAQARKLSPKPILTMYPAGFQSFHRRWPERGYENRPPGYLHFSKFGEDTGLVNIMGADMARIPERPIRSLFWSASYSFGSGSQIREAPFDPHCSYVFIGEEISMAARRPFPSDANGRVSNVGAPATSLLGTTRRRLSPARATAGAGASRVPTPPNPVGPTRRSRRSPLRIGDGEDLGRVRKIHRHRHGAARRHIPRGFDWHAREQHTRRGAVQVR